ncbi:hypothetical protein EXIGLDRAFT_724585 [Exidia glandulosa HHB12029]|uniref:Uncharacterized protein n=1 Tax=Exidia glandulosa HHB12029 TaxID=1314781 RepID=A0A165MP95_EXIGL|nr:hypothetical protein EXIGLDRAFT_724585 [Exidia glandulosa HHB12029]
MLPIRRSSPGIGHRHYHPYAPSPRRDPNGLPSQERFGSLELNLPPLQPSSRITSLGNSLSRQPDAQFDSFDNMQLNNDLDSFPWSQPRPPMNDWLDGSQRMASRPPSRHGSFSTHSSASPDVSFRRVSAGDVERICGRYGLDRAQAQKVHTFNEHDSATQQVELFALLTALTAESATTRNTFAELGKKMDDMKAQFVQSFAPPHAAVLLMRKYTRHYAVQPLQQYTQIAQATRKYFERKSDLLKITSYPSDPVIKAAISKILKEYAGQCRSNLHKVIWRFVARRVDLDSWANYMLSHYVHKSTFTDMMKARLALMRQVAEPLVSLPTSRGQDTGFWKKLNTELHRLYEQHGQQLESEGWKRCVVAGRR